ncbi:MAG: ATP-binding cassette domain-containing protein [Cyclobacteriaceae bacterium]
MSIKVNHISKSYGDKRVLENISFLLEKGNVYVLMGANGSGKTTLFNIISGFLKPDNGSIVLNDEILIKVAPHQINRKGITRTFQDMRLIDELTVLENVLLAFPNQKGEDWWNVLLPNTKVKRDEKTNIDAAKRILTQCFIDDVATSKAGELSYGQQKLLNIACCIANDAQVFLLDEPVAGVNPVYREKLVTIIKALKAKNKTVLIIEHNTDFIEAVADEIMFLNNGKILNFASYDLLRRNETVQEAYLL